MAEALYSRDVLRLAMAIPHLGRLDAPHGTAERKSPVCGSRITADVCLGAQGEITDFALDVHACALGQASAALVGQGCTGRVRADVFAGLSALNHILSGGAPDPLAWPGLEVFEAACAHPARHASIRLAFEALLGAIDQAR